ncbi:hypothetical protein K461DRAFT_130065 [Myriangium duriaei CBS 260.36]|uniref:Uncharacterized protein n=1 Tax=Myriangium duriaei CBS 260.36 TaxID=1168546 RepID=A0A9P4MIS2_9PEZI|nr:hypothetical protein K461DRAFT_130065 [Myriangium duriaei CBS 260.36]
MQCNTTCGGFWCNYNLAGSEACFVVDFDKHTMTRRDNKEMNIPKVTVSQVSNTIARMPNF